MVRAVASVVRAGVSVVRAGASVCESRGVRGESRGVRGQSRGGRAGGCPLPSAPRAEPALSCAQGTLGDAFHFYFTFLVHFFKSV